jgi:hypothetical protein
LIEPGLLQQIYEYSKDQRPISSLQTKEMNELLSKHHPYQDQAMLIPQAHPNPSQLSMSQFSSLAILTSVALDLTLPGQQKSQNQGSVVPKQHKTPIRRRY